MLFRQVIVMPTVSLF